MSPNTKNSSKITKATRENDDRHIKNRQKCNSIFKMYHIMKNLFWFTYCQLYFSNNLFSKAMSKLFFNLSNQHSLRSYQFSTLNM